jgi:hypothetical protein
LSRKVPLEERVRRGSAAPSPLSPLEVYDDAKLERDLLDRRPIRISVPEAVARLQGRKNLDWSGEVELPPPVDSSDHEPVAAAPTELEQRYRILQSLTYRLQGRIFYTMLGGDRYAARVDWRDS